MVNDGILTPFGYSSRVVDSLVRRHLQAFGGVEICGTRWCGKSWTAQAHGASITRVDENTEIYLSDPTLALAGNSPHVIDEWQDVPEIWNAVRHAIDDSGNRPGKYILTGSSAPLDDEGAKQRHSGAGRISQIIMRTMTFAEMGKADGGVSFNGLFRGELNPCTSELGLRDLAQHICTGGWPALMHRTAEAGTELAEQYLGALFERSMPKEGKSPRISRRIATSLARNIATSATLATIAADAMVDEPRQAEATVASYLQSFRNNYFIEELPGWDAPVRSKSRIRTKPKRYLADPSLAVSLLGINADRLLEDSQLLGLLFESLVVHDIAVYAQLLPGYTSESLRYYSDADGLEVDLIIELAGGQWAAIEVKLGENKVDEAISNLQRLKRKVALNPAARNPEPLFMAVILGKGVVARQDKDSETYVIPFACLEA